MDLDEKILRDKVKLPDFEPDLSPRNIHNIEAAKARNLMYDSKRKVYVDKDGCPTRDEYGQALG